MAQNQKSYDNEFKAQAVKLAQEIGGHKAANELGIPKGCLLYTSCPISNGNRVGISTDSSMIPHTRIFSQLHITLDNSSFCYILLF